MKLFAITLVFISSNVSQGGTITLAADPWCPITCEQKSEKPGVLIEVAKKIFAAAGHQLSYESTPWARAIEETRQGKHSAIVGALKSDAPDFIFPEISIISQKSCFFTKNKKIKYKNDLKFLEGQTLGMVKDYTYGEPLDKYIKQNPKAVDPSFGTEVTKSLFLKLISNRNSIFVEDKSVADYFLFTQKDIQGMTEISNIGCLKAEPLYIAFSPKNPKSKEYADIFSKGILKMQKDKSLQKIFSRYGLVYVAQAQ